MTYDIPDEPRPSESGFLRRVAGATFIEDEHAPGQRPFGWGRRRLAPGTRAWKLLLIKVTMWWWVGLTLIVGVLWIVGQFGTIYYDPRPTTFPPPPHPTTEWVLNSQGLYISNGGLSNPSGGRAPALGAGNDHLLC